MPIELPQDVYDAIDDASNRLSDAGITAKKAINEEKDETKEKNLTKKTKHPKQTLTASERARFTKIGEQLFLGALDKARQVKEA